ncbi:MAG: histidine triad nucleotide-binding protein [Magnetococcales bacterium]|nr:histidine triad nucleotide-binding protein [Magnetococcales bacterium]MBF0150207.1 histidine triad nucleotide-binding protein [Magnetococcales bacterium]MBF0174781.1 histidine triad nucleotide-binding protein [Magnetococcales bacterium]MBF0347905.1 histidine triad nucleotide-binding protein [Magnetococcales bacterium]MBF0631899.1 histidine triad nucleotide-binding protein [Magnetococcales bacterium]
MSNPCLFCKIVAGEIPAKKIYEDEQVLAFHDIHPQAPVHALIIPKHHWASLDDVAPRDRPLLGHLLERTAHVARELGVADTGYRTLINTKAHGGQEVFHIHVHVLGGRPLGRMVAP